MIINANTKIAKILKESPAALDAIVSIDSKFEKLRNPILRKLMAGRTSIGMAAKISGCGIDAFFQKLAPLGFQIELETPLEENVADKKELPAFLKSIASSDITELDVRPIIAENKDPLSLILATVKKIPQGGVLKIINSFEPTPLIALLAKQGFESFVYHVDDQEIDTYFFKKNEREVQIPTEDTNAQDWDALLKKFENQIVTIDVRDLEMPGPMMKILSTLDELPDHHALFVYHKRIPVFLLPELREKGFDYRIKEITDGEVHLFIFQE